MVDLETHLRELLARADANDLLRIPTTYDPRPGGRVRAAEQALISFASNDYLGLAEDPRLQGALAEGARLAAGAGSSRAVAGTFPAHRKAEAALAGWIGRPSARLFSSAYATNLGVLGGLFGRGDLLVCDALNHASLIDGCRLSRAEIRVYPHGDVAAAAQILAEHRRSARLAAVVTESAFSMDGDLADVAGLAAVARAHDAALVVDEAHALGVLGPAGRGVCAQAGVVPDVLVGGLGKSFGLAGGFVVGTETLGRALDNFARTLVFSTAILPAIAHAVPCAVELVAHAEGPRAALQRHAGTLRDELRSRGLHVVGAAPAIIVPVLVGEPQRAMAVAQGLRERGLLVPAMRPPTVPAGTSRLRITLTAAHAESDVRALARALIEVASPGDDDHRDQADHP